LGRIGEKEGAKMEEDESRVNHTRVGILFDRLRWEEKEIFHEFEKRGIVAELIDSKNIVAEIGRSQSLSLPSLVLQRCLSFHRAFNLAATLEAFGTLVLNSSSVLEICGNKLLTSHLLAKNGIPTPKTAVSFSLESALNAIQAVGYPCVMKPIIGSWGRQVVPIRDRETAEALIEMRDQQAGDSTNSIFYVQELVDRPPRDIRCITSGGEIIASVYRYAPPMSWKTNVALGGRTEPCPMSRELEEIVIKTSQAISKDGILGIDIMESKSSGYVVHEVNGTVEFRGAQQATEKSIAGLIVQSVLARASDARSEMKDRLEEKDSERRKNVLSAMQQTSRP
jgi:[lysine-biosynthesis-protein LysW]--L-2-aminoadipate ligase